MKKFIYVLSICILLLFTACSNADKQAKEPTKEVVTENKDQKETNEEKDADKKADEEKKTEEVKTKEYETVTIETFQNSFTFDKAPERVAAIGYPQAEILAALGLEDKIVGVASVHAMPEGIYPEYRDKILAIESLGELPTLEVLLTKNPDFVYGVVYNFTEYGIATADKFVEHNIKYYAAEGTYKPEATVENIYNDIRNLGKIFNIEDRADALIEELKSKVSKVDTSNIENRPKVLVVDDIDKGIYTAGKSLESNLIQLAGGENVFDDIERQFASVNFEEVAKRDADYILIHSYEGSPSFEEKVQAIKEHPGLANLNAVKNNKFIEIELENIFPSLHFPDAIETINKGIND